MGIILTLRKAAKSFPSPLLIFSVASKYICGSRMKGEEEGGKKQSVKKEIETRSVPQNLWEGGGHFKAGGSRGSMEAFHGAGCGSRQPNIIFLA